MSGHETGGRGLEQNWGPVHPRPGPKTAAATDRCPLRQSSCKRQEQDFMLFTHYKPCCDSHFISANRWLKTANTAIYCISCNITQYFYWKLNKGMYTGCGKKSSPLKFFAVFSATACNFNMEFYRFIYRNVLHLTAKWNMLLLKNDEIIDFWTWPPTDFLALKMFNLKMLFNFQKPVPCFCRWRHSDALTNNNLLCL